MRCPQILKFVRGSFSLGVNARPMAILYKIRLHLMPAGGTCTNLYSAGKIGLCEGSQLPRLDRKEMPKRTIEEIIKNQILATLPPDALVPDAVTLMRERGIGCVLIAEGEMLLGIFTDTDANRLLTLSKEAAAKRLDEVMTPSPVTILKTTTPSEALDIMARGDFKHLPITENGKLIGIVSRRDFF